MSYERRLHIVRQNEGSSEGSDEVPTDVQPSDPGEATTGGEESVYPPTYSNVDRGDRTPSGYGGSGAPEYINFENLMNRAFVPPSKRLREPGPGAVPDQGTGDGTDAQGPGKILRPDFGVRDGSQESSGQPTNTDDRDPHEQ